MRKTRSTAACRLMAEWNCKWVCALRGRQRLVPAQALHTALKIKHDLMWGTRSPLGFSLIWAQFYPEFTTAPMWREGTRIDSHSKCSARLNFWILTRHGFHAPELVSNQEKLCGPCPLSPVVAFIAALTFSITDSALFSLSIGWAGMLILVPWEQVELFTSQRARMQAWERMTKAERNVICLLFCWRWILSNTEPPGITLHMYNITSFFLSYSTVKEHGTYKRGFLRPLKT